MYLQDDRNRLSSFFTMPGIGVALVDFRGEILQVNEAVCSFLGYPESELKGRSIMDLTHPDDLEKSLSYYLDGAFYDHSSFTYAKRYIRKDGETIWGQVSAIRIDGPQGKPPLNLVLVQDITASQKMREIVAQERNFMQSVVDSLVDPIKVIGTNHQILTMNRAAREMLPADWEGGSGVLCDNLSRQFRLPCLAPCGSCNLEKIRSTGQPIRTLHRHRAEEGEEAVFEITAAPLTDETGTLRGIVEVSRNITERLQAEAKIEENEKRLEYITHYDLLTRLPNQTLLIDRLNHTLARAQRFSDKFAVLLIDLNRFRQINDSLGYQAGDRLLTEIAHRLGQHVRKSDTLARLRGDEFVIVLEQFDSINRVVEVARRLLDDIAREILLDKVPVYVTANIGISLYPGDSLQADGLLRCADAAMQRAREEGRGTYRFHTAGMTRQSRRRLELESQLRQALVEEQLCLYYQPQIDLGSGVCIGMEALMRWQHPQRGMVSPGEFIPLAEETGFIEPMGLWSLKTACTWNKALQTRGMGRIPVSVNISARQLYDADFPVKVGRILEETGLEARYLELEITESMLMKDMNAAIAVMNQLRELGVFLAMDDFGTGYSSLSYLHQFPLHKLKIDQSFVRDMVDDTNARAIARSITALAGSLGLRVIAEGVENPEQMKLLQEMGCTEIQGFLFSRPLPAAEMEAFLKG